MLFKTTTIMACMLISDIDMTNAAHADAVNTPQALTVSVPVDWQLKPLIDGAHLTEPKARQQGREIVFKHEAAEPDFADIEDRTDAAARFHVEEFARDDGADFVLTAWREFSGGWLVLRAFASSTQGRPSFSEAWQIFDSVATA